MINCHLEKMVWKTGIPADTVNRRQSKRWSSFTAAKITSQSIKDSAKNAARFWIILWNACTAVPSGKTKRPAQNAQSIVIGQPCEKRFARWCGMPGHGCFSITPTWLLCIYWMAFANHPSWKNLIFDNEEWKNAVMAVEVPFLDIAGILGFA